jgi:hypothetical protein
MKNRNEQVQAGQGNLTLCALLPGCALFAGYKKKEDVSEVKIL